MNILAEFLTQYGDGFKNHFTILFESTEAGNTSGSK